MLLPAPIFFARGHWWLDHPRTGWDEPCLCPIGSNHRRAPTMTQKQKIAQLLYGHTRPRLTATQIANTLKLKKSSVSSALVKMVDEGSLDRTAEGAPTSLHFGRYRGGWLYYAREV